MIVFIDGWIKPEAPGSLRQPMPTYMLPQTWWTVPLSFGLLMSPWGGHSVFPNIYKDMRHPKKYNKAVDITYGFTVSYLASPHLFLQLANALLLLVPCRRRARNHRNPHVRRRRRR